MGGREGRKKERDLFKKSREEKWWLALIWEKRPCREKRSGLVPEPLLADCLFSWLAA